MVVKILEPELYAQFTPIRDRSVGEMMQEPVVVDSNSTISNIIGLMDKYDAYTVFLTYNEKVASINMRDILEYRDIDHAKPSLLGKMVPVLKRDDRIGYAARIMSGYRLRALPVVEDGKVIGQITSDSIVRLVHAYGIDYIRASDIMTPNPVIVNANSKASTARAYMVKHKIDHLPVLSDGRLYGILTSKHILLALKPPESTRGSADIMKRKVRMLDLQVSGLADKSIVKVEPYDTLKSIASRMIDNKVAYTLVVIGEELQGIITSRDIVGLLQEMVKEEIPLYIVGLPDDPFEAELAKSKFASLVKLLRKSIHDLREAKCTIKIKDKGGERRRYEVRVNIVTLSGVKSYTANGYDLAMIFDQISDSYKKWLASKQGRKDRSVRYMVDFYTSS
jgi:CBS domain-containing protein